MHIRLLRTLDARVSRVSALAFSPRGDSITCGYQDGGVVSWDLTTDTSQTVYAEHSTTYTDPVLCVAYSPDGTLLAATNLGYYPARRERVVYVWRTNDHALAYTLGGFRYPVYAVAFRADGRLLAVAGDDRVVKLYEAHSGAERHLAPAQLRTSVSSLAFSPTRGLLVAGCDGSEMHVWDVDTASEDHLLEGHVEWTTALVFAPSGLQFASGGEDGEIILWDAATMQRLRAVERPAVSSAWWWGEDAVSSLAFNPAGTLLASARANDCVELWDPTSGQRVSAAHHEGVRRVAFSPDGAQLASGGNAGVRLWRIEQ